MSDDQVDEEARDEIVNLMQYQLFVKYASWLLLLILEYVKHLGNRKNLYLTLSSNS